MKPPEPGPNPAQRLSRTSRLLAMGLLALVLVTAVTAALPGARAQAAPAGTPVTASCLNSNTAEQNLSATMHNIFLVMAGIGGGIVVLALVYWGINHSAQAFEDPSPEQRMKQKRIFFDIIIGGVIILAAASIWGVVAGAVVGAPC